MSAMACGSGIALSAFAGSIRLKAYIPNYTSSSSIKSGKFHTY